MQRFFTDRLLGKLAQWLRVLGYDVVYLRQAADEEIVERLQEGRIFLTRGRRVGSWQQLGKVFVVNANEPKKQLCEVVQGLRLAMIRLHLPDTEPVSSLLRLRQGLLVRKSFRKSASAAGGDTGRYRLSRWPIRNIHAENFRHLP